MRIWREDRIYEPGNESLADTKSVGTLILDFAGSKMVRDKDSLFKPPVYGMLLQQPKWTMLHTLGCNISMFLKACGGGGS